MDEVARSARWACPTCLILETGPVPPACFSCGEPMVSHDLFRNPCSALWRSSMLEMIAHEGG